VLLLAAGLRLHLLGAQSLWNDEGSSFVQATRTLPEIARNAALDIHPPGYYVLLAGLRLLTGTSEFALRALSAFASILSVAFAYALGRRLSGTGAALTAALLVAVNTFSIYYAQEARMYALLALWGAASFWALAGFLRRPAPRWMVALALLNAAGLWTQYAFPFVMLAHGVVTLIWFITIRREDRTKSGRSRQTRFAQRPYNSGNIHLEQQNSADRSDAHSFQWRALWWYVAGNLLSIALYLPWLPTALRQLSIWPNTGDTTPFDQAAATLLTWLTFGISTPNAPLAIPAVLGLFGLLYSSRRKLWRTLIPALWVLIPVGLFLALGLFRLDNLKVLLPSQIGLALLMGRGVALLAGLKPRYGRRRDFAARLGHFVPPATAVLSVVWLVLSAWDGIPVLYDDPTYQRADYRAIVQAIQLDQREGDAVILDAPNQEEVFRYYYGEDAPLYRLPEGLGGDDAATRTSVERIIAEHERAFVVFWGETERDPQRVVETTLDQQAFEVGETWYGDVRLARYVMPVEMDIERESGARFGEQITLESYALSAESLETGEALQVQLDWHTNAALTTRYKVFLQLLDANGGLAAQRDSEPGGGLALTTTWTPETMVRDPHALLMAVSPGEYTLIVGLYELDAPSTRLPVNGGDYLVLATITVTGG
jgi:4-amino-4-deoxy-L-arabinose transferase-like glycosyltransferase